MSKSRVDPSATWSSSATTERTTSPRLEYEYPSPLSVPAIKSNSTRISKSRKKETKQKKKKKHTKKTSEKTGSHLYQRFCLFLSLFSCHFPIGISNIQKRGLMSHSPHLGFLFWVISGQSLSHLRNYRKREGGVREGVEWSGVEKETGTK